MASFRRQFRAGEDAEGLSIAQAMSLWMSLPIEEAQQLVRNRRVQINGNTCSRDAWVLRKNDVIHIFRSSRLGEVTEDSIQIVFMDEHIVCVTKPAGISTISYGNEHVRKHGRQNKQPAVSDLLRTKIGRRVHAVHRLDRDTSGIMVFALTSFSKNILERQFRSHSIERMYTAIAHGEIKEATVLQHRIGRDTDGRKRKVVGDSDVGDVAITKIRPVQSNGKYSVLECELQTGRTHQIRVQLAAIGHPVVGDKLYGNPSDRNLPRLALHATLLKFKHPETREFVEFKSPAPNFGLSLNQI